jgi:hypothetical protein
VLHAGADERTVKRLDIGGRDAVVSAAENAEKWRRQFVSALCRARRAVGIVRRRTVEANNPVEAKMRSRCKECLPSAKTEAQGEGNAAIPTFRLAQEFRRSFDIMVETLPGQLH